MKLEFVSLFEKAPISVESHLISVEGMMELENHHSSALIIITDSDKKVKISGC